MNKRRNKSVTKTKHRVQKTKRSRRLNKNRSVKGIRGNNKTKVVGKRRKIVQRGGGRIDDLVGRIFELDTIPTGYEMNNLIQAILADIDPSNFFQVARDRKQSTDDPNPNGPTLLYAACRLKNPSVELVGGILEKMKVRSTGFSVKIVTGKTRSVATMYSIIPNGSSNRSYPQHAAVQAAKDILEGKSRGEYNQTTAISRILTILAILTRLKKYDEELAQHIKDGKKVMTPTGLLPAGYTHTPLMNKKNQLSDGTAYTACDEYINGFGGMHSIRYMLEHAFQPEGHAVNPIDINDFDEVLAPTYGIWEQRLDREKNKPFWYNLKSRDLTWNDPSFPTGSIPVAPSAGAVPPAAASALPHGWVEKRDPVSGRPYYVNTVTGQSVWEIPARTVPHPAAAVKASADLLEPGGRDGQGMQLPGTGVMPPGHLTDFYSGGKQYIPPALGWMEKVSDDRKSTYWVKHSTGEIMRTLPHIISPFDWIEKEGVDDRGIKATYYINRHTNRSQWEYPPPINR